MSRLGRPKKKVTKLERVYVRLSSAELKMLEQLSFWTNTSKSEIIRNGIKMQYDYQKLIN